MCLGIHIKFNLKITANNFLLIMLVMHMYERKKKENVVWKTNSVNYFNNQMTTMDTFVCFQFFLSYAQECKN